MTKHFLVSFGACVPNGRQVYQVSNVATTGGTTTGTINSEVFDKKANSKGKASGTVVCTGGEMRIDMKLLLPPQENQQFGMSAEVNAKCRRCRMVCARLWHRQIAKQIRRHGHYVYQIKYY